MAKVYYKGNLVEFDGQENKIKQKKLKPDYISWASFTSGWYSTDENGNVYADYTVDDGRYMAFYQSDIFGGVIDIKFNSSHLSKIVIGLIFINQNGFMEKQASLSISDSPNVSGDIVLKMMDYVTRDTYGALIGNTRIYVPSKYRCMVKVYLEKMEGSDITTYNGVQAKASIENGYLTINAIANDIAFISKQNPLFGKTEVPDDTFLMFGLFNDVAEQIVSARNAWMRAWGGDLKKIPIVYTSDQHSCWEDGVGIYNFLNYIVPWGNVSRIFNFGDSIFNALTIEDNSHPYETEHVLDQMKYAFLNIPYEKQVNIIGNHDVMTYNDPNNPKGYLTETYRNFLNYYFTNHDANYFDKALGDFVIYDKRFNVKYVCVAGWEYGDGTRVYRNTSEQMDAIIEELEKNDGYDIVLVSHVPLSIDYEHTQVIQTTDPNQHFKEFNWGVWELSLHRGDELWNGLLNHTSGTVLDSDGNSHSFDFRNVEGNLLCGLSGHTHTNAWYHVGNTGVLNILSKNMYSTHGVKCIDELEWLSENENSVFNSLTVTFALIDRKNEQVEVWNVSGAEREPGEIFGLNHWIAPMGVNSVSSLSLDKQSASISVNGTTTITATTDVDSAIVWVSSDESVVKVLGDYLDGEIGETATITGYSAGSATITAYTEDGTHTATCTVTVSAS